MRMPSRSCGKAGKLQGDILRQYQRYATLHSAKYSGKPRAETRRRLSEQGLTAVLVDATVQCSGEPCKLG